MLTMDAVLPTASADDETMLRVARGDSTALATLFDRHKARLFGFLYHLVGDRALAEDLLGETFLRVYQNRAQYRNGSGFVPWLFAIARNLAIGEMRRRGVRDRAREKLLRESPTTVEAWAPERTEVCERVRAALAQLPEDQRSALVLKEYMELEYRQIGQVLGCSEEAARARAYRARAALRKLLKDWWEG